MPDQPQRNAKGQLLKGHKGLRSKGTPNKKTRDLKLSAERVAKKLGGRGGIAAYLESHPKLLNDLLIAAARDRSVPVDADGNPVKAAGPFVDTINIVSIPCGWTVVGLLGRDAHLPRETVVQLRELLPPGSIHQPPCLNDGLPAPLPFVHEGVLAPELETETAPELETEPYQMQRVPDDDPPAPADEEPPHRRDEGVDMNDLLRSIPPPRFPKPPG